MCVKLLKIVTQQNLKNVLFHWKKRNVSTSRKHQTEKKNSVDTETRHKKMMTSRILIISERRHSVHATRTGSYKNEHSENKKELIEIKKISEIGTSQ